MANAKTNTTPLAGHCNSLFEAMVKLSDTLAILDLAGRDEESQHGGFSRAVSKLLHEAYDDIEKLHLVMEGEAA